MKISRKAKTGCAVVLAAMMTLTGLSMQQSYAATAIDENVPRSITVSASIGRNHSEQDEKYVADLESMNVPVVLYKVADVDVTGQKFTPVGPFGGMTFDIDDQTTAAEWQELAAEAMGIMDGKEPGTRTYKSRLESGAVKGNAAAKFDNPELGMYLVVAGDRFEEDNSAMFSYNTDYTKKYIFAPYLTVLPSSAYTTEYDSEGNPVHTGADGNVLSDDWIYDTTIGLKVAAEPLYGRLNITKELQNFNETLGRTTFTFLVEGRDPVTDELLYSDVVSTTHEELAAETVTLEEIPAGITATVTEIYSGASYETVGENVKTVRIWSDEAVENAEGQTVGGEVIQTPAVTFENRYNGGNRGGYGVNNEFELREGVWEWTSGPAF